MKIGYLVNRNGEAVIFDKEAELRNRGVQFDVKKPTLDKKGTVYIFAEDQLVKGNEVDFEKNIDKILENYDQYKDLWQTKKTKRNGQSTKKFEWGYPKQNPNIPKKYYGKKTKK